MTPQQRPPSRPARARSRRPRRPGVTRFDLRTLAAALSISLVAAVGLPALGSASSRETVPTAADHAPTLEKDLRHYLDGRATTAAVDVRDLTTGREYRYHSGSHFDSASVVKIAIMAATLRRQERAHRTLTAREVTLLKRMIRVSDNSAATSLWNRLGRGPTLQQFFTAAGMTHTTAGLKGYWGLTRITAADEVVLMAHLARPSDLLTEKGRAYARKLMSSVDPDQDWGVSAGPKKGDEVTVELKNGWLPRPKRGWAVHSVGHVQGEGRDYLIAVLSLDNQTQHKGIVTVEGLSTIVWRDLAPR